MLVVLLSMPSSGTSSLPELAARWLELPGPLRGSLRLVGLALALTLTFGWQRRFVALGLVPVLLVFGLYAQLDFPLATSLAALLILVATNPAADVLRVGASRAIERPNATWTSAWFRLAWLFGTLCLFVVPLQAGSMLSPWILLPGLVLSLWVFVQGPVAVLGSLLIVLALLGALTTAAPALFPVALLWALVLFDEAWVQPVADDEAILFFDGLCVLCNRVVQFILLEEQKPILRFTSLDSPFALAKLAEVAAEPVDSIVLLSQGRCYVRSEAALLTARAMGGFWGALWWFRHLPVGFRDAVYDFIARNRYRWFGKLEACPIPPKELRARTVE